VQEREDWILQDDIDLPIGLGNDDILDNEEDDFGTSDDYYLSAEEDDGAEKCSMPQAPHESAVARGRPQSGQHSMITHTSLSQMQRRVTARNHIFNCRRYVMGSATIQKMH
jgi:hypothetical protein